MIKLFKNKKGFAMAELLAVSIVLLFIFSILFSNYLPLVAEYENRLSYNDVTAQYAAHYIRKMYKEALLDEGIQAQFNDVKSGTVGYKLVYKRDSNAEIYNHINSVTNTTVSWANGSGKKDLKQKEIENVINEYGIEEIIITRYKLDDSDSSSTNRYVKDSYNKDSGSLYNYIKYLPNYEKSIYTGNDLSTDSIQLYRIILKTKDYGYATTPILSDYKTPGSCFEGDDIGPNTLIITKYLYNEDNGCGNIVTISNTSIKTANGKVGKVVAIGDDVFRKKESNKAYQIKELNIFSDDVKSIGAHAFDGSLLEKLPDSEKMKNVTSIGDYAFANTLISDVNLEDFSGNFYIGDYAFADNIKLTTVKLPKSNIFSSDGAFTKGLFARSGTDASGIEVTIPGDMKKVGDEMFYLAKINSITLTEGVETIGDKAFSQFKGSSLTGYKLSANANEITIPSTVENIGYGKYTADDGSVADISDCFRGLGITKLIFTSSDKELKIGASAFRDNNITSDFDHPFTIPYRVKEIGASAFENSNINYLVFDEYEGSSNLKIIGSSAFKTNNIVALVLPDSITSIGERAFEANSFLKSVKLPNNEDYTTISLGLFQGGNEFESIDIPKNVQIIKASAFNPGNYPSNLKTVNFNKDSQLTTIESMAFANNKNLKEFTIPKNVNRIMNKAFASCGVETITNNSSSSQIIDKLYSNGCEIFFRDASSGTCSSSISDDRKNIVISYEKGYTVTITNNNVG